MCARSGHRSRQPVRSGYANGYQVVMLSDCTAATSVEEHENAIRYDYLQRVVGPVG